MKNERPAEGDRRARRRPIGRLHRLRIDSIAAGGEGVGRLDDGRVVFAHRTAPGDLVDVELVRERKRWARARLRDLVEPSELRREPACPHYLDCGGCTLEHLTYQAQLQAKRRIVDDTLRRIGGLTLSSTEIVPSPLEYRYRNRVSFSLRRLGPGSVVAGFHSLHDPDRILDLDGRCLLPEEPIAAVWDGLRTAWGPDANRLPSGERLRLTLRANSSERVSLLVDGGYSPGRLPELVDAVDGLVAAWHRPAEGRARWVAGDEELTEQWGGDEVEIGGAAFLQVNRSAAELLERHVVDIVGPATGLVVVDAYCGVGLHARRLARAGAFVVGLEIDSDAVDAATSAGIAGTDFIAGDVAELLPRYLPADLVILNPPRSGLAPSVTEALSTVAPERLIYVSCDPATLARDLQRLQSTFHLAEHRCFDLFPQTAHVETVALLERRG